MLKLWHPRPEPNYTEIAWQAGTTPEEYAEIVLDQCLPVIRTRDDAMDALTLCFPFVDESNRLRKIAGAVYFTRAGKAR